MTKVPLNIPNILTFFRFALIVPAVFFAFNGVYIVSFVLFSIACLTDFLDGYIARRLGMVSDAGILLDPLADKLMAVLMVTVLAIKSVYPLFVAIIIFVKEALMILGGIILYRRRIVAPANIVGKIAAFVFNVALAMALLNRYFSPDVYLIAMYAALALMLIAFVQYAYFNAYKRIKEKNAGNQP